MFLRILVLFLPFYGGSAMLGQTSGFETKCFGERWQKMDVCCIAEHPNGLTYIGTNIGVFSYDGENLDSLLVPQLEVKDITDMEIDDSGNFFFSLGAFGVAEYNAASKTWVIGGAGKEFQINSYLSVASDDDYLYYGTSDGLLLHEKATGKESLITPTDFLPDDHYPGPFNSNELKDITVALGAVWCATPAGLLRYSIEEKEFTSFPTPFKGYFIKDYPNFNIEDLFEKDGVIYMATWGGDMQKYDIKKKEWDRIMLPEEMYDSTSVLSITGYSENEILYGRTKSLPLVYDALNDTILESPVTKISYLVYKDRFQNIYLGHGYQLCIMSEEPSVGREFSNLLITEIIIGSKRFSATIPANFQQVLDVDGREAIAIHAQTKSGTNQPQLSYRISDSDDWEPMDNGVINLVSPGGHFDVYLRRGEQSPVELNFRDVNDNSLPLENAKIGVALMVVLLLGGFLYQYTIKKRPTIDAPDSATPLTNASADAHQFLSIRTTREQVIIPINQIIYCKASSNYCQVVTSDKEHLFSKTLKYVQEQLPADRFIRVHNSYLVNRDFIEGYVFDNQTVKLKGDHHVPVSKKMRSFF